MKLRPSALAFALLVPGCATPASRSAERGAVDGRPAWACTAATDGRDLDVSVVRTLDAAGEQLGVDTQWSIGGFDRGRLALMAISRISGSGEPPLRPSELLVSWSGFPDRLQRERLLVVLHPSEEAANPLDGVAMIPYVNGLVGAVLSWQRVSALAHNSTAAQLTLMEPDGRVIRSAPLELTRIREMIGRTRAALSETRARAATFRKSCEPVTEWMRL